MIDRLMITNFKAFAAADISLAPYTLLSGLNSSGKSTVLQALALLNNRPVSFEVVRHVCRLNGPFATLEALQQDGATEIISALTEIDGRAVMTLLERVIGRLARELLLFTHPTTSIYLEQSLAWFEIKEGRYALSLTNRQVCRLHTFAENLWGLRPSRLFSAASACLECVG